MITLILLRGLLLQALLELEDASFLLLQVCLDLQFSLHSDLIHGIEEVILEVVPSISVEQWL